MNRERAKLIRKISGYEYGAADQYVRSNGPKSPIWNISKKKYKQLKQELSTTPIDDLREMAGE